MKGNTSRRMQIFLYCFVTMLLTSQFSQVSSLSSNLSCYQCEQYTNKECGPEYLKPCPSQSDRCVTHIVKSKDKGFTLKRECGLAPCTMKEVNIHAGLAWDDCDRSKEEYFCVFCCRESGCNKSSSPDMSSSKFLLCFLTFFLNKFYNICRNHYIQ